MLAELTVKEFMEQLSQGTPMPGGGSVAALSGAAAADLVAMVCALTIGKKGYEDSWEKLREIEKKAKQAGEELLGAMDEDAQAYSDVVACFRMPKETEEEKKIRA
ncbi:MAG: cyclodeaminase/cyclohydrolase family protein, partial [Anaerovoracaceae bacterium]|nr:cyclodeaminase/cyclohydrolase family protein [Anaerovoracaceae bacterium]